jgi:hypothetical protein
MDDSRSRSPEADIVFRTRRSQEFVDLVLTMLWSVTHLLIDANGSFQVFWSTLLSLNQVITMHSSRNSNLRQSSAHKLQNDHLSSRILTSNPIRSQIEIRLSTNNFLCFGIIQVTIQDLFRVCQGSLETLFDDINVVGKFSVT